MAPARSSVNRARRDQTQHPPQPQNVSPPLDEQNSEDELFLDPLMGTPLAIYVEKDVENRDEIVELVSVCHPRAYSMLRRVFWRNTDIARQRDTCRGRRRRALLAVVRFTTFRMFTKKCLSLDYRNMAGLYPLATVVSHIS